MMYSKINLNDYKNLDLIVSNASGQDIFYQLTQLLSAEVDDYLNQDVNKAIDKYLSFLGRYENSIYYEDIRLRLGEMIQ